MCLYPNLHAGVCAHTPVQVNALTCIYLLADRPAIVTNIHINKNSAHLKSKCFKLQSNTPEIQQPVITCRRDFVTNKLSDTRTDKFAAEAQKQSKTLNGPVYSFCSHSTIRGRLEDKKAKTANNLNCWVVLRISKRSKQQTQSTLPHANIPAPVGWLNREPYPGSRTV